MRRIIGKIGVTLVLVAAMAISATPASAAEVETAMRPALDSDPVLSTKMSTLRGD